MPSPYQGACGGWVTPYPDDLRWRQKTRFPPRSAGRGNRPAYTAAMPNLVCTGATLQCSNGTEAATFSATGARVSAGGAAGVVSDIATANNQPPAFGECTSMSNPAVNSATQLAQVLTPQPCLPVLTGNWTPGSAQVTVGQVAVLTSDSQCTCSWGGAITVTNAGQTRATLGAT